MRFLVNQTACNSYMAQRNCLLPSSRFQSASTCKTWNWTCEELTDWCLYFQHFNLVDSYSAPVNNLITVYIEPILSIISPFLFCVTLFRDAFSDNSAFIYLRVVAFAQFMGIICKLSYVNFLPPATYTPVPLKPATAVFSWVLLTIDPILLSFIPTVSLCLAFERCLSLCKPILFSRINSKKMAIMLCIFSFLFLSTFYIVGNIWLVLFLLYRIEWLKTQEFKSLSELSSIMSPIAVYYRYYVIALLVLLSILILYAMTRRMRKIKSIMSAENAKTEIDRMRNVCKFQLIESFLVSTDFIISIIIPYILDSLRDLSSTDCSYPDQLDDVRKSSVTGPLHYLYIVLNIQYSYQLFFIYLFLNKLFRKEFILLTKAVLKRFLVFIPKLNTTTTTAIQVISVQE